MPTWQAQNIEPESDSEEEEYDETKEIQIEDAIKLYQTALKLHSQGPPCFDEADKAYKALLASEIFTWPESQSDYQRLTSEFLPEEFDVEIEGPNASTLSLIRPDSAPSNLPQVLYLSYKNYGQFLLDRLAHQQKSSQLSTTESKQHCFADDSKKIALRSLQLLVNALDKDEADPSLWRKVARVGGHLGSRRLARYALESALALFVHDETFMLGGSNPEEMAIRYELADVLRSVGEDETLVRCTAPTKPLSNAFRARLDPLPSLRSAPVISLSSLLTSTIPATLRPSEVSWESVGNSIMQARQDERDDHEKRIRGYIMALPNEVTQAGRDPVTTNLVTAESLCKNRPSQSPASPTRSSQYGTMSASASLNASPVLRQKGFGAGVENEEPKIPADITGQGALGEVKSADGDLVTVNQISSDPRPPSKRSLEVAGLVETPEAGRSRSKRLRARAETLAEESVDPKMLTKYFEEQLQQYIRADEWVFSVAFEMSAKAGIKHRENALAFRSLLSMDSDTISRLTYQDPMIPALIDFKSALSSWTLNKSNLLLNGAGAGASVTLIDNGVDSGFAAFLEHSKAGSKRAATNEDLLHDQDVQKFADELNANSAHIDAAVILWIEFLLKPTRSADATSHANQKLDSKYTKYIWPHSLKELLTQLLVDEDNVIYTKVCEDFSPFQDHQDFPRAARASISNEQMATIAFIQTVFELHLDIYGKMTAPDSKVDQPTRIAQKERIRRWAEASNLAISRWDLTHDFKGNAKSLALRHVWSTVLYVSFMEIAARDHILLCYQDLKAMLEDAGSPVYFLINNTVMPEISVDALEREMSKEKTLDFFSSIFGTDSKDPVSLIESLEPVLMETLHKPTVRESLGDGEQGVRGSQEDNHQTEIAASVDSIATDNRNEKSGNGQLADFLQKATAQLKLSLWHQLKTAYDGIDYPPMKIICNIRSMDIIIKEIQNTANADDSKENRSANLIVWIRNLADLVTQCLEIAKSNSNALDFLAEGNMRIALTSCVEAVKLFHVFATWEDSIRIEQLKQPPQPPGAVVPYRNAMSFLREMQPRVWQLLYLICVDAALQNGEAFPNLKEDRLEYLRAIHNAFGLREYCRLGRKCFLKFLKTELIQLDAQEDEISQVLYDLYNLKICQNSASILEHGCTGDQIDRASALEIVPFVIGQANRMNAKDVLKSDLKIATEKMQAVIGTPRGSALHQAFNKRTISNHLKSLVLPLQLFKSLRGLVELTSMPVNTEYATVARRRWFFLMGDVNLARYKSQKRVTPDNSDDLENADKFLKLDLEFNTDSWETWYRLAQTYDARIEEDVTWDAIKINDPASDLVSMQKQAIHCYEMAVSLALRYGDESFGTANRISELYSDFAMRIYSSSREPFNMKAFSLEGYERYFNRDTEGTFKRRACKEVDERTAWKVAAELYRKALLDKPHSWQNWYMLGKCRWKLFQSSAIGSFSWRDAVDAFVKAIQCVPGKRDSRHPEKDPILDPHYKLLSIVYKLLKKGEIPSTEGIDLLKCSHFSRKVSLEDSEQWEKYIADILRVLRTADKANWHHRMIARAAHIEYDDVPHMREAAQTAKDKLTQQIFTKSMIVQVWKPEFERPGRHFVYASRYVRFFARLLEQLGDRASLELLGKRIRKKQNDFVEHEGLWTEISHAHLRLLRRQGSIPSEHEDAVFKSAIPFEVFTLNANRLETWAHSQLSLGHPTLLLLQEAIELKKLNGTLIDKHAFDELVGDLYARIYEQVVPELIAKAGEAENRERMRIERMLMDSEASQPDPAAGENAAPSAGRTKTISRTEVRRRAEALVARPVATVGRGRAVTSTAEPASATRGRPQKDLKPRPEQHRPQSDGEGMGSVVGSLHDSADDESELSELDDDDEEEEEEEEEEEVEEQEKLLFPNLATPTSEASREASTSPALQGEQEDGPQHEAQNEAQGETQDEMEGLETS